MDLARTNYSPPFIRDDTPFPQAFLEGLFPREMKQGNFDLHYYIASNAPLETIEACARRNPEKIVRADSERFDLTPMHLVAMTANFAAAKFFLSICPREALHSPSHCGFTAMHFAAMTSEKLFFLFLLRGGDANIRTAEGASCQDLLIHCGRKANVHSSHSLFFQGRAASRATPIWNDPSLRRAIFSRDFYQSDCTVWTSSSFESIWLANPFTKHDVFIKPYKDFCENPPSLILAPCEKLMGSTEHFLELRTRDSLPSGQILSECAGLKDGCDLSARSYVQSSHPFQPKGPYCFLGKDATLLGNESRFLNCGFPNACVHRVFIRGVSIDLIVAIEPLEKGEAILIDYGKDSLQFFCEVQILLGKEKMIQCFEARGKNFLASLTDANKVYRRLRINQMTRAQWVTWNYLKSAFLFPLHNPTALLFLHFKKLYDYSTLLDSLTSTKLGFLIDLQAMPHFKYIEVIVKVLQSLKRQPNGRQKQAIEGWVLQNLEKKPLTYILKGLDCFVKGKSIPEVDALLKAYDWQKDEKHPLLMTADFG